MVAIVQNFKRSFGPSTPFFHSLSLDPPATMEDLYRRVDRYSTLEDNISASTQTIMITSQSAERNNPTEKKATESKEGKSRNRKQSHDQSHK